VLFFAFLFLPLVVVAVFAFNDAPYPAPPWRGFTLDWFIGGSGPSASACLPTAPCWQPVDQRGGGQLGHAAVGAGRLRQRVPARAHRLSGKQALSLLMLAPLVIPGVILGISILAFASRLAQFADDLWGLELEFLRPGLPLVVLGQFSYIVSIATLTISARLKRFDVTLEDAAYNLGASRSGGVVDHHPALPETGADRRGGDLVPDVVRELQHHADAGRLRPAADGDDVRPHARRRHAGAQCGEPDLAARAESG
jgi:spermidine/putrescine transport system permease protein